MKKIIITHLVFLLLILDFCIFTTKFRVLGQEFNLNGNIEPESISDPMSLPVWNSSGATDNFSSSWGTVTPVMGIGAPIAIYGAIKKLKSDKRLKIIKSTENNTDAEKTAENIPSKAEIIYDITFKGSKMIPVYPDTVMYIKIPDMMSYSSNSLVMNGQKIKEEIEDNILRINLKDIDSNNSVHISFMTKMPDIMSNKNTQSCLIRFKSISQKEDTGWKKL